MAARTQYETFNRDWQQTVAWAQTQGIGPSSYLPVYQLDLNRISTGGSGYAMGRAERNNAIIAAHNPNQVTPVPSDNPSPTHIWSNAASDVGKIATGLIGIFTGSFEKQIWHSAEATVRGVEDPASLDGNGIGGTIGNWLNDTLLAYVPGAADLGTLFQQGPAKGLDTLASHPVLSLLDVMPDIGGEESAIARIAGRVDPALKESIGHLRVPMLASGLKAGGKYVGDLSIGGKAGSNIYGQWKEKLSVSDRLQGMLAKSPGVGPLFSKLSSDSSVLASMGADEGNAIMGPVSQDLETLAKKDPDGVALLKKAMSMKNLTKGDSIDRLMKDQRVSPAVKVAAKKWLEGPGRFVESESAFRGGLPHYDLSGNISMHSAVGPSAVGFRAIQEELEKSRDQALAGISELEPHAERLAALDSIGQKLAERWAAGVDAARQGVVDRPEFQTTLDETSPLRRDAQLRAVIGEGGLVDDFKKAISTDHPDPATVEYLAGEMMTRLSTWGVRSVNGMKVPELVELYKAAAGWRLWAKHYHKEQDSLDRAIEGSAKAQKSHAAQAREDHKARIQQLDHQHKIELANLEQTHQQAIGELRTRLSTFSTEQRRSTLAQIKDMRNQASVAAQNMTSVQEVVLQAELVVRERRLMDSLGSRLRESTKGFKDNVEKSDLRHRLKVANKKAKHKDERAALARALEKERRGYSDITDEVGKWASTTKKYHRYLYDHPADQYRDAFQEIWKKKLMKLEETAAIKVATEKFLSKQEKDAKAKVEIDKIRNDPGYLAEYTAINWGSIMRQPDLDPELRATAETEMQKYADDALQTIKQMVAQGFKIPYIPSATVFSDELGPGSILSTVSHGIKRPDVDKAKTWMQFTPTKDDFAVGMNKAVVQELDRQAKIHLFEDTLAPMTLTRDQLSAYIHLHGNPVQKAKLESLTATGSLVALADEFGWRQFDTTAYMGTRLPRWGDQEIFLPKEVARALDKMDQKQKDWLLTKGTKLFRYSILGLSPRYDAHVIFGGALMLALRSTPYILSPDVIGRAWEAVRTGSLPSGFGHPAEEGYEAPTGVLDRVTQATLDEFQHASGKDLIHMATGENIERVQGISRYAAKPIHALRALAELNLRFTRHIREMQYSMAYFDALGKWERQHGGAQYFTDPDTGREIRVTPERAMKEGMHHVQQVYGNLAAMSPFEQQVARTVMPFYGWQKHVIGYILSFPFDHPMRALILSQMAYQASNDVPKSWPIRIQFLHFLGAPDASGNIKAIDLRSLDPFRDVANYMSLTGVFESLNPALSAPLTMAFGPQAVYGESSLYPGMSYNAFYGINTASSGGNILTAAEAYVPQIGAIQSALALATNARSEWKTNPSAAAKTLLEQLNIPFVTPDVNLKQQSARSEAARYEQAYNASKSAFSSGDFSQLKGYPTVPNPLNPAYTMTPAELEALYNQQQAVYPGISPAETALPPPTPYGW